MDSMTIVVGGYKVPFEGSPKCSGVTSTMRYELIFKWQSQNKIHALTPVYRIFGALGKKIKGT